MHLYGNRPGDNAPHAIIELVDGPKDLKFEMTARAVGRETVEAALAGTGAVEGSATSSSSGSAEAKSPLREVTRLNLEKTLKYRSEEDKQRFRQIAADWAVRISTLSPLWYSF